MATKKNSLDEAFASSSAFYDHTSFMVQACEEARCVKDTNFNFRVERLHHLVSLAVDELKAIAKEHAQNKLNR